MLRPNRARDAALLDLADAGTPTAALAARFGISRNAVIGALWRARRRLEHPPVSIPAAEQDWKKLTQHRKLGPIQRGFR